MRIEIDTNLKRIIVLDSVLVGELMDYIKSIPDWEEYSVESKLENISPGTFPYTPYTPPYTPWQPTVSPRDPISWNTDSTGTLTVHHDHVTNTNKN